MQVYRQETGYELPPVLFLEPQAGSPYRAPSGPLTVLREGELPATQWHLPETAYELVTRPQVYDEIRAALESAKLSKPARTALEKLLDELPG